MWSKNEREHEKMDEWLINNRNHCTFATLSYTSIALIHLHRPSAAEEAFATILGSKSGLVMYSERIFCITGTCSKDNEELITAKYVGGLIKIRKTFFQHSLECYPCHILWDLVKSSCHPVTFCLDPSSPKSSQDIKTLSVVSALAIFF